MVRLWGLGFGVAAGRDYPVVGRSSAEDSGCTMWVSHEGVARARIGGWHAQGSASEQVALGAPSPATYYRGSVS